MSNPTISARVEYKDVRFKMDALSQKYGSVAFADSLRKSDAVSGDFNDAGTEERIALSFIKSRCNDIYQALKKYVTTWSVSTVGGSKGLTVVVTLPGDAPAQGITFNELIGDYIACGALSDWYRNLGVGNVEPLMARCAECLAIMREIVYFRQYPTA